MTYDWILPGKLAQGSAPKTDSDLSPFTTVVLCAGEYQPTLQGHGTRPGAKHLYTFQTMHVPMRDGLPDQDEIRRAVRAGREVASRIRRNERVLITCWMGLNRSGLIVALALLELGVPLQNAVGRIRQARKGALFNPHFMKLLRLYASKYFPPPPAVVRAYMPRSA